MECLFHRHGDEARVPPQPQRAAGTEQPVGEMREGRMIALSPQRRGKHSMPCHGWASGSRGASGQQVWRARPHRELLALGFVCRATSECIKNLKEWLAGTKGRAVGKNQSFCGVKSSAMIGEATEIIQNVQGRETRHGLVTELVMKGKEKGQ